MKLLRFKDRAVNLKHVINVLVDASGKKICFNMDYSITKHNGGFDQEDSPDIIPDYVTFDFRRSDPEDFLKIEKKVMENFEFGTKTKKPYNDSILVRYYNPEKVASVVFRERENRIILNFCSAVTQYRTNSLTSSFLYLDFSNYDDYLERALKIELV